MTKEWLNKLPSVRGQYLLNEPMKKHTWLGVGGAAEVMFYPADENDLQYFLRHKPQDISLFILGGGSNLLVRDGGIKGITIKLQNKTFAQWRVENDLLICGKAMAGGWNFCAPFRGQSAVLFVLMPAVLVQSWRKFYNMPKL